jgi:hypothetical protein
VMRSGSFVFWTCLNRARHLARNSEMVTVCIGFHLRPSTDWMVRPIRKVTSHRYLAPDTLGSYTVDLPVKRLASI